MGMCIVKGLVDIFFFFCVFLVSPPGSSVYVLLSDIRFFFTIGGERCAGAVYRHLIPAVCFSSSLPCKCKHVRWGLERCEIRNDVTEGPAVQVNTQAL
jgi:hypothetical protein